MTIHADALKDFRQTHRGDLITPQDPRYEEARRVWNAMIDRRPAVIARPRGADVVVADGRIVHASSTENPGLFWAVRGGGGNFGVVTSFEYRLQEVGPMIIGGLVVHPFPRAKGTLKFFAEFMPTAPDELVA